MKNIAILLLLFFINCSSQQISTNKKYMDMETTFQKYRDIKAEYDTMVARNKQNLVYENGAYFDKAFYDKEAPEKRYEPEKSDSKFILEDGGKAYFVKNYGQSFELYTIQGDKVVEQASLLKKNNMVYLINNYAEGIVVRYRDEGKIEYIIHYVQDKDDPTKRDIMLRQEFVNNKLATEKNYKQDFIVSKEQMLKKLANNFYSSAISYNSYNNVRKEQLNKDEIELINNKIALLKESITKAIASKNFFYKEIKISKNYNQDNQPIYDVSFPFEAKIPTPNAKWDLQIDGKTNKVLKIEFVNLID